MLCNSYETLRGERPYKLTFNSSGVFCIIINGDGRTRPERFDLMVPKTFIEVVPRFGKMVRTQTN